MEALGVAATADALELNGSARAAPNSRAKTARSRSGPRIARRAWRNPKAGSAFVIKSEYEPKGDQPTAIKELVEGVEPAGTVTQVLLGVTGSGKTYTMAKVIEATQRPAIILAPNKMLAAQLL